MMQRWLSWFILTFTAFDSVQARLAGSGERESHFLGKRPGLNEDVKLWNEFLRSENQPHSQDEFALEASIPEESSTAFLDTETKDHDQIEVTLRSCLRKHVGPDAKMPAWGSVPRGGLAAVVSAAVAGLRASKYDEKLLKVKLQACVESTQQDNQHKKTAAKAALVETDVTGSCTKVLKGCKKDLHNCEHVLDILQFLRLQHIAVEKTVQREADAKKRKSWKLLQTGPSLQSVLEKHGFSVPTHDDWDWTRGKTLLLQSALEEHSLALMNENWNTTLPARDAPLFHPIPEIAPKQLRQHSPTQAPTQISLARPLRLEIHHARCPAHTQKQLDECGASLESCKVDVDDHNSILNSIAARASQMRRERLEPLLHPKLD